ncbi:hypothetical protein EYC57_03745 [Xanthomonas oryzae]|nr:hypothetical protein EYC57_03745 [Xanthomonas oryzae]
MICSSEKRFFTSNLLGIGNWTPNRCATQTRGTSSGAWNSLHHLPANQFCNEFLGIVLSLTLGAATGAVESLRWGTDDDGSAGCIGACCTDRRVSDLNRRCAALLLGKWALAQRAGAPCLLHWVRNSGASHSGHWHCVRVLGLRAQCMVAAVCRCRGVPCAVAPITSLLPFIRIRCW